MSIFISITFLCLSFFIAYLMFGITHNAKSFKHYLQIWVMLIYLGFQQPYLALLNAGIFIPLIFLIF